MNKIILIVFCILAFADLAGAQGEVISNPTKQRKISDEKLDKLKRQAKEFYQAQFDSNITVLSKFIYYPKTVKESAEKEIAYRERNAKDYVESADSLKTAGVTFEIKRVNEPTEIIKEHNQLISLVTIDYFWITKEGKCEFNACVLGISQNNGETWEFFNGSCSDETFPKRFGFYFPKAVKKISFPKRTAPNCIP